MRLEFFVPGLAKTQGSKKAFYNNKTGRAMIVDDNPKTKQWRSTVNWYANRAMNRGFLIKDPVRLILTFWRERRSGDFRISWKCPPPRRRNLRSVLIF